MTEKGYINRLFIFVFVLSACITPSYANGICKDIGGDELISFINTADFIETDKNKRIDSLFECMETNSACVVGGEWNKSSTAINSEIIKLWKTKELGDLLKPNKYSKNDMIFMAAIQVYDNKTNKKGCVIIINSNVQAVPWFVKGWLNSDKKEIKGQHIEEIAENYIYKNHYPFPPPQEMVDGLLQTYDEWINRLMNGAKSRVSH